MDCMFESISQKSEQSHESVDKPIKHRKKWEFDQTKKYYEFLIVNREILQQPEKKQKQRIYNRMSEHVGSRSTHQCRSHHQKIMKRHSTIDNFMAMFRAKMASMDSKGPIKLKQDGKNQKKLLPGQVNKTTKLEQSSEVVQIFIDEQQSIKRLYQNQNLLGNAKPSQETLPKRDQSYKIQNYHYKDHPQMKEPNLPSHEQKVDFSGLGNQHINSNCRWAEGAFQKSINQERFLSQNQHCSRDDYCCLHGGYCRLSQPLRLMAQKAQDSDHQPIFYKTASENKKRQQQFPPCISISMTHSDNINLINPSIEQNKNKSKNKQIKESEQRQQNYRMWFQKPEELKEIDGQSDSEEIRIELIREITIDVLKNLGLVKEKDTQNQKLQKVPDLNLKPQQIQQSKPTHSLQYPTKQKNALFPPSTVSKPSNPSLFPNPLPVSLKNQYTKKVIDLEDRRRTDDSYSSQQMSNEMDLNGLKQMENQQQQLEKAINFYYRQQALLSERQTWQEFPPVINKAPCNFQSFPEFEDPIHSSHLGRFYSHEFQQPVSFSGIFSPCNNPNCVHGCKPRYMQTVSYLNQHYYQPPTSHNNQHYNFQKRQPYSNFPPRGRRN